MNINVYIDPPITTNWNLGAKRQGSETSNRGETSRGETSRGGNGFGAKRPGTFFFGSMLFAIFLTERIDYRRSGIQNIELGLLCVWMKEKNVAMFYFIVVAFFFFFFLYDYVYIQCRRVA